jgi:hypothetical protein
LSPRNGTVISGNNIVSGWGSCENLQNYVLQVDNNISFDRIRKRSAGITKKS